MTQGGGAWTAALVWEDREHGGVSPHAQRPQTALTGTFLPPFP